MCALRLKTLLFGTEPPGRHTIRTRAGCGAAAVRQAFASAMAQWPDIRFERKCVNVRSAHFVSE